MAQPLQYYISCFMRMNCNKRNGETAPHKAVMLMAVMEEVRLGHIINGFIPVNDSMVAAFKREWDRLVGVSPLFNPKFETPFFHLGNEPFWDLMKREPFVELREYSLPRLRENFFGAKIPDDLYDYMSAEASRRVLKRALLDKYLPDSSHQSAIGFAAEPELGYDNARRDNAAYKLRA